LAVPYDLLLHILALLEPYDLCTLAQACSVRFSIICLARTHASSHAHARANDLKSLMSEQTLNEVSCSDHLWRRFCGREATRDEASGGRDLKSHYMGWLRPRLNRYATERDRTTAALPPSSQDHDHQLKCNIIGDFGTSIGTLSLNVKRTPCWLTGCRVCHRSM
jgi:hypothetical protein